MIWTAALISIAFAGPAIELGLRSLGFRGTVPETYGLWAHHRSRATGSDPVVLVGISRIVLGTDPEYMKQCLGRPVVQLGIQGSNSMPVLADLASDTSFAGTVILSLNPAHLVEVRGQASDYVERSKERQTLNRSVNLRIGVWLRSNLALLSGHTSIRTLISGLVGGDWLETSYMVRLPNRSVLADYSRVDLEQHRAQRLSSAREEWGRPSPPLDLYADSVSVLRSRMSAIEGRGGQVVLVRFPMSQQLWEIQRSRFPKEVYWDRLPDPKLHFTEVPEFRDFSFPDESHLDYRDKRRFTQLLVSRIGRLLDQSPHAVADKSGTWDCGGGGDRGS